MSWQEFDDQCEGCKPVVLDPMTMRPYAPEHPFMLAAARAWTETTYQERQAFHNVTCLNSRDSLDLAFVREIKRKIKLYVEEITG